MQSSSETIAALAAALAKAQIDLTALMPSRTAPFRQRGRLVGRLRRANSIETALLQIEQSAASRACRPSRSLRAPTYDVISILT
jgi:hypothetical protein